MSDEATALARTVIQKYGADADKPSVHLAKALLAGAHERDTLRAKNERMATVITQFRNTVSDARRAMEARGKGGQQVPFHGDFCNAPPSTMTRLNWWARELEISTFEEDPK